jgi:Glycosyl hydrolase family 20, catalytic domain
VDPLSKHFDTSSLNHISYQPEVKHLGVLLDAGRHYFNLHWIRRMIDVLAAFELQFATFSTDFNVMLRSQPSLVAYPSTLHNNTRVYTPQELKEVVQWSAMTL